MTAPCHQHTHLKNTSQSCCLKLSRQLSRPPLTGNLSIFERCFGKLLQRNLVKDWLEGVNYAVFGLGDSGYQKYNDMQALINKINKSIVAPLPTMYSGALFGTISAVQGSDILKQSEKHKRKARAERFGLAQSVTADEEAKKKARLSRFGEVPAAPKANAQEEDKRKAIALNRTVHACVLATLSHSVGHYY
ncbi:hypothetical protein RHMOL_Rhmol01G0133300 [Rhododendron molle]|uniref:Uncharacterized protein n=1 Tax=Rhododendron molle TaxID=49168 RepID=A0ACC0Q0Q9_RHOML|nr:hypothetical protein RHMOL_Rhmol01G0133300 [Rhododendron molle]